MKNKKIFKIGVIVIIGIAVVFMIFSMFFISDFIDDDCITIVDDLFLYFSAPLIILIVFVFRKYIFEGRISILMMLLVIIFSYLLTKIDLVITEKMVSDFVVKKDDLRDNFFNLNREFKNVSEVELNIEVGEEICLCDSGEYKILLKELRVICLRKLQDGSIEFLVTPTQFFSGRGGYVYLPNDSSEEDIKDKYQSVEKIEDNWYIFYPKSSI